MIAPADSATIARFRDAVVQRLGLYFDDGKWAFLGEVLQRRLDAVGGAAETYIAALEGQSARAEIAALAEALTVGETYFFRANDQLRAFAEIAVPERLRANAASRRLRVLSAACASGEEAYSIAIILRQIIDPSWKVTIRAIDINPAALRRAKAARYSAWSLRDTPTDIQERWFRSSGREAVLDDDIRAAVSFEQRNLAADDPELWEPDSYDVVFCRNVLMYFTPQGARDAVARISRGLVQGGYLFLGHAETLRGLSNDYHLRHSHESFYYQRHGRAETVGASVDLSLLPTPIRPSVGLAADDGWVTEIGRAADRVAALTQRPPPARHTATAVSWNLGLALDLLQRERFSEALSLIDALPAASNRDPDVLLLQAMLFAHSGRPREAAETAVRLLAIDEMNAGAHYVIALSFEEGGDRDTAASHYRMAIHLDPGFAMPRLHLGIVLRRAGDFASAKRELAECLARLPLEEPSRLLLFGGGFTRDALIALCQSEIERCSTRR